RAVHSVYLPPRSAGTTRRLRRALWLLSRRCGSRAALPSARPCRPVCPGGRRISPRQCHAGPLESSGSASDLAQPTAAHCPALRLGAVPFLLLADSGRAVALGPGRLAAWGGAGVV